jgi:dynein light chain Tctex-type 1
MGDEVFEFQQISKEVTTTAVEVMSQTLESKRYIANKTGEWIDSIGSNLVTQLRELSPNFKYIVSTVILQKTGAGWHSEVLACWDANTDGAITSKFESDSLICICTVIGVAL